MSTLRKLSLELFKKHPNTRATLDQRAMLFATYNDPSCEKGLKLMIDGLEAYCRALKANHDYIAGDDGYCGPLLEDIAKALHYLLSGPGKFDGGTCSAAICEIARTHKLNIE